jgi:hypothetical protein
MRRNRASRRRIYEASDMAINMRETFVDRSVEYETEFDFTWPSVMQNVGDSLAVAYASDKWKPRKKHGKRDIELYKHLAEGRNRLFCFPGIVRLQDDPGVELECIGPMVSFDDVPKPEHFAILAMFKEANVQLYTRGTNNAPRFGRGTDAGVVTLTVKHGMIGGGKLLWSKDGNGRADQPFLFVYTADDGVMFLIVGKKLDVLKDGIVG